MPSRTVANLKEEPKCELNLKILFNQIITFLYVNILLVLLLVSNCFVVRADFAEELLQLRR